MNIPSIPILSTDVRSEHDVWLIRQRARQLAALLGFDLQDQTRIATAVSEIARNAVQHAGGGRVEFRLRTTSPQVFEIQIRDTGPGIADIDALLHPARSAESDAASPHAPSPHAPSPHAASLRGVRRLMDSFTVETAVGEGTRVTLGKRRPQRLPALERNDIANLSRELTHSISADPHLEMQRQNQELLRTLEALRTQQDAAQVREQWLSATLRSIGDAVIATDAAGLVLFMNAVAERLTGWTQAEAAGQELEDIVRIIDGQTRQRVAIPSARILGGETIALPENALLVARDDRETCVGDSNAAIHDADSQVVGAVLVLRDTTQAIAAQRERQHLLTQVESERTNLRTMMEQMPAGVFMAAAETGALLFANYEAKRLYGVNAETDWRRFPIYSMDEESLPVDEHPLMRALAEGQTTQDTLIKIDRPDGSRATLLMNAAPIRQEGIAQDADRIVAGVVAFHDVTDRMEHQRQIEDLNVRLRRSILETHHRVKNNLQIIAALVEVQTIQNEPTVPLSAMTRIGEHARALAGLHDLLTSEAKVGAETNRISAKAVVEKLLGILRVTIGTRSIQHTVEDFSLPVRKSASLALLTSEIISNSIKHGQGEISLSLTSQGSEAVLEICDDGPGFPPNFDWRSATNTGFSLIESAGSYDLRGTLTFENRPEGGARVRVSFPIGDTSAGFENHPLG